MYKLREMVFVERNHMEFIFKKKCHRLLIVYTFILSLNVRLSVSKAEGIVTVVSTRSVLPLL